MDNNSWTQGDGDYFGHGVEGAVVGAATGIGIAVAGPVGGAVAWSATKIFFWLIK